MPNLFEPVTIGKLQLPSRLLMAPMTRSHADAEGVVGALTAEYYRQRSSAGLIISESIQPNVIGQGYIRTPGLHTGDQVEGWRGVTDAVHEKDGRIFAQLTHTGRIGRTPASTRTGSCRWLRLRSPRASSCSASRGCSTIPCHAR